MRTGITSRSPLLPATTGRDSVSASPQQDTGSGITVPKRWTFKSLPEDARASLLTVRIAVNAADHREKFEQYLRNRPQTSESKREETSARSLFDFGKDFSKRPFPKFEETSVIWGTDDYSLPAGSENNGDETASRGFHDPISEADLLLLKPRLEKSVAEQARRRKEKAEVFTPVWVVNMMNNTVDDRLIGTSGSFNTVGADKTVWVPRDTKVPFRSAVEAVRFIVQKDLEIAAGEAPYLATPYDPVSGEILPVRDSEGRLLRVGRLDRKLRVVLEVSESFEDWIELAFAALRATYGFEWQGDNLVLARLNLLNTFFDYLSDACRNFGNPMPKGRDAEEIAVQVAEILSWNLWQMDGLKMTMPLSCPKDCGACKSSKQRVGHDGQIPVIRWQRSAVMLFEELLR